MGPYFVRHASRDVNLQEFNTRTQKEMTRFCF